MYGAEARIIPSINWHSLYKYHLLVYLDAILLSYFYWNMEIRNVVCYRDEPFLIHS